ncbi:homeobox-DDT domain protein RLT1 isoform X2 [Daucus carota subsp. sativus]|uniref:homeobox-DDT domain protein RLT1 isoform X2 n=1 Tax=Daucus carota subsp. sativus TaxID=79200 RepID=UPI0007EF4131|nr:PREDICTED: homeobox-DDT domain protein RLT1-like isoform X2 [Daucus carota subsp. sativus]
MDSGSDGESNKNSGQVEGFKKPKRQMKTPFQLETLERTYAAEMYPSEAIRAELSVRLGLTDRQLQMWFCHRRLKDKKEGSGSGKKTPAAAVGNKGMISSSRDIVKMEEQGSDGGFGSMSRSRSGSGSGPGSGPGSDSSQYDDDLPLVRRSYVMSPQEAMMQRVIACVEGQLGEPLREDGPVLGMEFDEVPPGAFGEPISAAVITEPWGRSGNFYEGKMVERSKPKKIKAADRSFSEPAEPSSRPDSYGRSPSHFYILPADVSNVKRSPLMQGSGQLSREYGAQVPSSSYSSLNHKVVQEQFSSPPNNNESILKTEDVYQIGQKRKSDEVRTGKDVAHEKRIRKELEKQDLLRRKREELMRKEMERQERERKKEEERMMREKMRMEEKYQREEKREIERREKFLQRELLKAERMRQKEELRREREAAKQKAAMEKAALRRVAKESLELIEDERLELMELAASSKGLPSIISLDYDTLQNLESFRDSLCAFPPKDVQLKKPFSIQPWIDSEDNIGNLLMVWRFCVTFSDVLGLWPFTLDEFIQALHDYDSRLLAEIHIALLNLIIKDIEEGARTPSGGAGTNQYTVANPEGGHPHIVEGAFLWGFDIRSWQKHLNPLTWPEILRQFALSAGFGPQLRKESTEPKHMHDNEVKSCEDIVSMLRNGSAVENAVAVMQEKGSSLQRRSRHRLTPGTVKFAAYHVLCLEGGKGQTVLELAEKIQKSGLRDLSTSKTPDASISVALSRDPVLFERIAPSTYCVRPAFRKDPANAEEILAEAREKIQKFSNGLLAEETADDVEKDDDSESDVAEGPEFDELSTLSNVNKDGGLYEVGSLSGNAVDISCNAVSSDLQNDLDVPGNPMDKIYNSGKDVASSDPAQGVAEIDESKSGEEWVQGLSEGEYCVLCVEDRLSALVAIISVVNEGNIIRAVLEDRLDAANALRKQMWAEAQLDKRRLKDENLSKFHDPCLTDAADGSYSPSGVPENKNIEVALDTAIKEEPFVGLDNIRKEHNNLCGTNYERNLVVENTSMNQNTPTVQHNGSTSERSRLQLKSFIGHRAEEMHVYRSLPLGQDRRHNRYWQFVASASRHDPGSGRIFVELRDGGWRMIDSEEAFNSLLVSLDTRGIRESHLHIMLQHSQTSFKENLRRNLQLFDIVGNAKNSTENQVTEMDYCSGYLAGHRSPRSAACDSRTALSESSISFRIDVGKNEIEKLNAYKRYQVLKSWVWKECINSMNLNARTSRRKGYMPLLGICDFCFDTFLFEDNRCPSCQRTFSITGEGLNYSASLIQCEEQWQVNPSKPIALDSSFPQIRLIKALLSFIEVSIPPEAFQSSWTCDRRSTWGKKLQNASSVGDLLQILTQLEGVIKQDYLSSNYETTAELLGFCTLSGKAAKESDPELVPQLPWIPQTTAAVALRLLELDSSIFYTPLQKAAETNSVTEAGNFTKLSSRSTFLKDVRKAESTQVPQSGSGKQVIRGRGGARPRGKSQKKVPGSRSGSGKQSIKVKKPLTQILMQPGENMLVQRHKHGQVQEQGQNHKRGPRTVRRRRESRTEDMVLGNFGGHSSFVIKETPRNFNEREWISEEMRSMQNEHPDNNTTEESESDDNADTTGYREQRWEPKYNVAAHPSTWDPVEMSDEDAYDAVNDFVEDDDNMEQDIDMNYGSVRNNLDDDVDMNDGLVGNNDEESFETSGEDYSD